MSTRRSLLAGGLAGGLAAGFAGGLAGVASNAPALARAALGEDGLYHLDWYLESFLDLAEDLAAATAKGKRFAILWGLKGCPACRRMHMVHLAEPRIESYLRSHFEILHLNILGARPVTDFDGTQAGEKALAARYGVNGTPAIQFFPETLEGLPSKPPAGREVMRMPGLPEPEEFLAVFRYVREKGYERGSFADWAKKA
jgi:thioredoxin-related protein